MSPGYSRDWSLGLFENAFWEVSTPPHMSAHTEAEGGRRGPQHINSCLVNACDARCVWSGAALGEFGLSGHLSAFLHPCPSHAPALASPSPDPSSRPPAVVQVLSLRIEPLPTLMVSLRPSASAAPAPLSVNTAVPFHAPLATFAAPFPFESGCDPTSSTRLAVSYEILAPGGPASRSSSASGYSRIILVRLPSPSDSDPHRPTPPTPTPTHALPPGGETGGAVGEGSGGGEGVGVASPEVALTSSASATQLATSNTAVTAQKTAPHGEAEREKEVAGEGQGEQDRVVMRPSREEEGDKREGGQRRRALRRA